MDVILREYEDSLVKCIAAQEADDEVQEDILLDKLDTIWNSATEEERETMRMISRDINQRLL